MYGEKPGPPDKVSGTVTKNKITVEVEDQGKSISFSMTMSLPSGEGPFPAVFSVQMFGMAGGLDNMLKQKGIAIINYDYSIVGKEGQAEASRGKPNTGAFYDLYGGTHSAGLLMAWAWGVSRIIDVLEQSGGDIIDTRRLGVTGCSRAGKGAFTIGVFDDRIALTFPQESFTGGYPSYRYVDILGQENTSHHYNGLNWLSDNFGPFVISGGVSNAVKLPIDTHSLMGMIAPRGLLILDNIHQSQGSPKAGHAAAAAGKEIYKALGVEKNITYFSAVSASDHCSYKSEYDEILEKSIAKFLKHEDVEAPGQIVAGNGGDGNPSEWITWETPTLEDDTTIYNID